MTIASWTRGNVQPEVLPVMAATLLGSISTIAEALGRRTPQSVTVESEDLRLLATRVDSKSILVLIGPRDGSDGYLRHVTRQIVLKLGTVDGSRSRRVVARALV